MSGWLPLLRSALRARLIGTLAAQASAPATVQGAALERSAGSWLEDGFDVGAEVRVGAPDGAQLRMVRAVSASVLTLDAPVTVPTPVVPVVALPQARAWEGLPFTPPQGRPLVVESVREVAARATTVGAGVTSERTVLAGWTLHYPSGQGTAALERMAGAIARRFAPGTRFDVGRGAVVASTSLAPVLISPERLTLPVTVRLTAWIEDP